MNATIELRKLTVADFRDKEFDDNDTSWYELINGELVKKSSPTPRHQEVSAELNDLLRTYIKQNKLGRVYYAPIDVFLDGYNTVQPDLLLVLANQSAIVTKNGIEGTPSLIIEIISPTSVFRDRVVKKQVYEQFGVQEYWIVDAEAGVVEQYVRQGETLNLQMKSSTGELRSAVIPGFVVPVAACFQAGENLAALRGMLAP